MRLRLSAISGVILLGLVGSACVVVNGDLSRLERRRVLRKLDRPVLEETRGNAVAHDARAAALGHFLFYMEDFTVTADAGDREIRRRACVSCHDPRRAFTDGLARPEGALPEVAVARNSPTLLDVSHREFLFADGRADSLWSQAVKPLEDPTEMGSNRLHIAHRIHRDAALRAAYERVFGPMPPLSDRGRFPEHALPRPARKDHRLPPAIQRRLQMWHEAWDVMAPADRDAVTVVLANVGKALDAHVRRLVSGEAPLDRFVAALREGDQVAMDAALSPAQVRGLELFVRTHGGCAKCHAGREGSDDRFHYLGVPGAGDRGREVGVVVLARDELSCAGPHASGCEEASQRRLRRAIRQARVRGARRALRGEVRTPSLRNAALTGPYMHDGSMDTLREVLEFYDDLPRPRPRLARRNRFMDYANLTVLSDADVTLDELMDLEAFLHSFTTAPVCEGLRRRPSSPVEVNPCTD